MEYKARVLVTAGGGGVGQSVIKAIKLANERYKRKYTIYTTDINPLSAGLYRVDKGFLVPAAKDPEYIDKLVEIALREKIDIVIPASDPELPVLSTNKSIFYENGVEILVGNPESIKIGYDKWATYLFLKENGFDYPKTALPSEIDEILAETGFPLLIKPRYGSGSVGVNIAENLDELKFYIRKTPDPIIQEYLQGDEYTTGVLIDKDGEVVGSISLKRELKKGATFRAVVGDFPEIRRIAEKIALSTGLIGPVNIQMKLTERGPVVFEINPRFSGTTVVRAYAGFNEPDIIIRNVLFDEKVTDVNYETGIVMMRYLNELFIGESDLKKLNEEGYIGKCGDVYKWY